MKVSNYEENLVAVRNAMKVTKYMDEVVAYLRGNIDRYMPAAEIGKAAIPDYRKKTIEEWNGKQYEWVALEHRGDSAHLAHMLRKLREYGFVECKVIDGEPIEVIVTVWNNGDYEDQKKMITPEIMVYRWCGD